MSWDHGDSWDMNNLIKFALRCVGDFKAPRSGVDGSTRQLQYIAGVAGIVQGMSSDKLNLRIAKIGEELTAPVITQHYDCTPLMLAFGTSHDLLAEHARYLVPDPC